LLFLKCVLHIRWLPALEDIITVSFVIVTVLPTPCTRTYVIDILNQMTRPIPILTLYLGLVIETENTMDRKV
jgi:hypothetical protein